MGGCFSNNIGIPKNVPNPISNETSEHRRIMQIKFCFTTQTCDDKNPRLNSFHNQEICIINNILPKKYKPSSRTNKVVII